MEYKLCIIIPCYNEASSFRLKAYENFLTAHKDTLICFVNDGSNDGTEDVLQAFLETLSKGTYLLSYNKNQGKAEAVKRGMNYCEEHFKYEFIAYLDADLAVSLEECYGMISSLNTETQFVFGSRIQRIGSIIQRKRYRFLVGRIIATFISQILNLKVYDTQCGCKLFTKEIASYVFDDAFISKWLFDVEIFFRLLKRYGEKETIKMSLEIPLLRWVEQGDSKVRLTYFFKLWIDLIKIKRKYR